ncbi:hypothetical protein [Tenacibaculum finnmarkense]|uniref:hypothetical protein n=1 Tax=Tenacibaculum finnmarkense TaxID=2781243 RepID=UPI001EFAB545|nr:hypothetical protein [Tenacibaculum finnmarkense]MCG8734782.1 hypothetical protein [Tenacibaculum finnmarkense]
MSKEQSLENKDKALHLGGVSNSTFDKEDEVPYCTDCGNEYLAYLDQYANGEHWECKECKKQFIW